MTWDTLPPLTPSGGSVHCCSSDKVWAGPRLCIWLYPNVHQLQRLIILRAVASCSHRTPWNRLRSGPQHHQSHSDDVQGGRVRWNCICLLIQPSGSATFRQVGQSALSLKQKPCLIMEKQVSILQNFSHQIPQSHRSRKMAVLRSISSVYPHTFPFTTVG